MGAPVDLFAAASAEGAWTVGEVTRRTRAVIEAGLPPLWVRGEIAGFKAWRSGHWYFSLRDKSAQLRCVMFAKQNFRLPTPADGMQVFVFARPSLYEEKGEFQLTVMELLSTEQGGLWKLAFEKAKAALTKDGLLDPARKRRLPLFPNRNPGGHRAALARRGADRRARPGPGSQSRGVGVLGAQPHSPPAGRRADRGAGRRFDRRPVGVQQ